VAAIGLVVSNDFVTSKSKLSLAILPWQGEMTTGDDHGQPGEENNGEICYQECWHTGLVVA